MVINGFLLLVEYIPHYPSSFDKIETPYVTHCAAFRFHRKGPSVWQDAQQETQIFFRLSHWLLFIFAGRYYSSSTSTCSHPGSRRIGIIFG